MQISCLGWLCESVKLDLGTLDGTSGSFGLLTNVIGKVDYYYIYYIINAITLNR